jgi:hypothetical protein
MAASRLSDSQKIEIVARYRAGEGSSELAGAYGCSAITVSRAVKAALDPAEYDQLKQQRSRPVKAAPALLEPPQPLEIQPDTAADDDGAALLAIEDADDFGDDFSDDFGDDDLADQFVEVPLLLGNQLGDQPPAPAQCLPLAEAQLPVSVYMLVDKIVELQAKPLKDFPELGLLPDGEGQRQALLVFVNPRQAKRQCGRSQRVIKVPDTRVLERTAPYLIAQGISRVVIEGSLYSLPGS